MTEEEKEEERRDKIAFISWGVVTVVIVLACVAYPWALMKAYEGSPENAGVFGDQYGALNALFSGIAFAVLVATVFLQRNELRATRREMREQNATAKVSAHALSLSNPVQVLSSLLNADLSRLCGLAHNAQLVLARKRPPRGPRGHLAGLGLP